MDQSAKLNIAAGILLLMLSVFVLVTAQTFPDAGEVISPGFFPSIAAGILAVLAAALIVKELIPKIRTAGRYFVPLGFAYVIILYVCGLTVLYIIFAKRLGFILISSIYLWLLVPVLGERRKLVVLLFGFSVSLIMYLIMALLFRMYLPRGFIEQYIALLVYVLS